MSKKKEARKKMLKELRSVMHDDMHEGMKDKMDSMQKVSVSSDSKEGLKKGLSKAQEILKKRKEFQEGGVQKSLGKGQAEYRGWKEDPKPYDRKKPEYLDHRKLKKKRLK